MGGDFGTTQNLLVNQPHAMHGGRRFTGVTLYQWRPPNALHLWHAEVHRRWTLRDFHAAGVKYERGGAPVVEGAPV